MAMRKIKLRGFKRLLKAKSKAKIIKPKTNLRLRTIGGYVSPVDYALLQAKKREAARKKYEKFKKLMSQPY